MTTLERGIENASSNVELVSYRAFKRGATKGIYSSM